MYVLDFYLVGDLSYREVQLWLALCFFVAQFNLFLYSTAIAPDNEAIVDIEVKFIEDILRAVNGYIFHLLSITKRLYHAALLLQETTWLTFHRSQLKNRNCRHASFSDGGISVVEIGDDGADSPKVMMLLRARRLIA